MAAAEPPLALPDTLALPRFATARPSAPTPVTAAPEARAPALGRGAFELHWGRTKVAMAPCDDAVAAVRRDLDLNLQPDLMAQAFRRVDERCSAAAVNVGMITPPDAAGGRVLALLQEGRDACQRSMIEKQMAIAAIAEFRTRADLDRLRETRIRVDAIERGSLACRATFSAAAEAARLPFADAELAT